MKCKVWTFKFWPMRWNGSAPRPPNALLALRGDGVVSGSVSGGCVEDDLIARVKSGERSHLPTMVAYGVSQDEAARFGLPCGGTLRLVQEPLVETGRVEEVLHRAACHQLVSSTLTLASGQTVLANVPRGAGLAFNGSTLTTEFGPRWRLLLIGAGQLSQAVAHMALLTSDRSSACSTARARTSICSASHVPVAMPQPISSVPSCIERGAKGGPVQPNLSAPWA